MCNLNRLSLACLLAFFLPFSTRAQQYWQPFASPGGIEVSELHSNRPGEVFISNTDGIFYSSDNGLSWKRTGLNIPVASVANYFYTPGSAMYLRTLVGVRQYDPASNTWRVVSMPQDLNFENMAVSQNDALLGLTYYGKIYLRKTGINSPFETKATLNPGFSWSNWIAALDETNNLAYNNSGKLYHFPLSGPATAVMSLQPNVTDVKCLAYHPVTGVALFGYNGQLLRSTDKGLNWQPTTGLTLNPNGAMSPYFANDGVCYLSASGKWWVSHDDAATWTAYEPFPEPFSYMTGFTVAPDGDLFIAYNCNAQSLQRSTDGGLSWMHLEDRLPHINATVELVDFNKQVYIRSCNAPYLLVSPDDGHNWAPAMAKGSTLQEIEMDNFGRLFATGTDNKLYKTGIGNSDWTEITPPGHTDFTYNLDDHLALGANGKIYLFWPDSMAFSADLGNTWTRHDWFLGAPEQIQVHPNGHVYSVINRRAYRSTDNGASWTQVFTQFNLIHQLHITASGAIFLQDYINGGQPSGLKVSYDNGITFQQIQPNNLPVYNIVSAKTGEVFVKVGDDVLASYDNGQSWQSLLTGPVYPPAASYLYLDRKGFLYTGAHRDIFYRSVEPVWNYLFVEGKHRLDEKGECMEDPGDRPATGWKIAATGSNNTVYSFCGNTGNYRLIAPEGDYSVNILPQNALWKSCQDDMDVTLSTGNPAAANVDLAAYPLVQCPYLSVSVGTPLLRRCFPNRYSIEYCNTGTAAAEKVQLRVELDPAFELVGASRPWSAQNGQTLVFDIGTVASNECGALWVEIVLSCDAELGETHCLTARLTPELPCANGLPPLSFARDCRPNIGSFDPNDKQAFVDGQLEQELIAPGKPVEYQIRFQNTGTDTAFRVVVEDRLSPLLDIATVEPLVASHPYRVEIRNGNTLRFVFENIMLPDSNTNEPASHGFVKFRVAQRAGNQPGAGIDNFADIFFDFNEPVRTNTIRLTIALPQVEATEATPAGAVRVYPNPVDESVTFEVGTPFPASGLLLRLFDPLGREIRRETFSQPLFRMARQGMQAGLYFFRIESENQVIGSGKILLR